MMAERRKGTLAILGNGPSLRSVDLHTLSSIETLGMNAAYRFWDRIDWRPKHYSCLDDALIETHAKEIRRLIEEGRIQSFFLTGRMLQLQPDLREHPKVKFLDEFVPHWHRTRGQFFGLDLIDAAPFRTNRPELLTTGAYAARYAAWLNFKTLLLFGFDLTYADLPEAAPVGGLKLEMAHTPERNPNYFFDDYQKAGDLFHVPNPASHQGDLHFQSFVSLAEDFEANRVPVRLINAQDTSKLADIESIASHTFDEMLTEPALGQIVIPYTEGEVDQIRANFWLWSMSNFAPSNTGSQSKRPILSFVACDNDAYARAPEIRAEFNRYPVLNSNFSGLEFANLNLSGDANLYVRDNRRKGPASGLRAGPNNLFFGAMTQAFTRLGNCLYMESDCIPLKSGWVDYASTLLSSDLTSWVMGSIYLGDDALGLSEKRHVNGNAIYATSDPSFQVFVRSVWEPKLRESIRTRPELPFDCLIEHLMNQADSTNTATHSEWSRTRRFYHRFRHLPYILNYAGCTPRGEALVDRLKTDLLEWPEAHLVHSRSLAQAVLALRQAQTTSEDTLSMETLLAAFASQENHSESHRSSNPPRNAKSVRRMMVRIRQRLHRILN